MPDTITAIKPQKYNRKRFSIFVNGIYRFSLSETLACRLKIGEELSCTRIADLESADQYEQALSRALNYLGYRPRSCREVLLYLEKKGYTKEVADSVINRLEDYGYIDDDAFVRFWIDSRERNRPKGEFALRYELKSKGISETVIDAHLSEYDESGPAWQAVAPRLNRWQNSEAFELKKQIHAYLARRGFTYATCEAVWKQALETLVE